MNIAPSSIAHFKYLAEKGFYNGSAVSDVASFITFGETDKDYKSLDDKYSSIINDAYVKSLKQKEQEMYTSKFTLVGATTRAGLLTAPLRDRFGMIHHLEFYTIEELQQIIMHSARILDVEIEPAGAKEMARRSRGTPRLANRILKRVRDFAQVKYDGIITEEVARTALDLMDVDKMGLDHIDRNILVTIIEKFDGGPVGLDTLAAAIGEDAGTIEDVYEPYLIKNGFLNRTPKGRVVTDLTYHHLGLN